MYNEKPLKEFKLGIAGVVISISTDEGGWEFGINRAYRPFITNEEPDVNFRAHYSCIPHHYLQEKAFDSGSTWSLYRYDGKYIFNHPFVSAAIESDFKSGDIYIRNGGSQRNVLLNPLAYPLSEVLLIILLSRGQGVMFHACGIDDNGQGYLFLGNSTHGKSTMAGLWSQHAYAKNQITVLNDDRIVAREKDGRFWIYGTPWHGNRPEVSPRGVPIHKIFILHRGCKNSTVLTNGIGAVSMLLTRCFPPIWDKKGMDFTVDFCRRLVEKVPCYELDFTPDKTVVEFIRNSQ